MANVAGVAYESRDVVIDGDDEESSASAVSWGAIVAGAFAASALALILYALGAGFGLSSISPWSSQGASAGTVGIWAVSWLIVTQWLSAGFGGYMAGRLRTKWSGVHTDEVFFRDTAHGFLAWAVGAVITGALLTSTISSLVGSGAQTVGTAVAGIGQGAAQVAGQAAGNMGDTTSYLVDTLFRSDKPSADANDGNVKSEIGRIMTIGLKNGEIAPADKTYLAQVVANKTGIAPADAQKRIDDAVAQVKDAADKAKAAADEARKAAAYLSFATCLSMLVGAFVAAVAGALGGHRREANEGLV